MLWSEAGGRVGGPGATGIVRRFKRERPVSDVSTEMRFQEGGRLPRYTDDMTAKKALSEEPSPWEHRFVGEDTVPAQDLVANPQNFRKHPKAQRQAMTAALDSVGWIQRVIVNRTTARIVDGHLRVEEAAERGESVPVVYVELSEDEERAALLSFDPLGALAQQDNSILDELLADTRALDLDVPRTNLLDLLHGAPPINGLTDPDDVPEAPAEPTTKLGDLWVLGDHRVLCGDSTSAGDVERLMDGRQAQLTFTDPPYGVDYDGDDKRRAKVTGDHIGTNIYEESLRHLATAADDEAALYLWYADGHAAAAAAGAAGYVITAQVIWAKNHAQFVTSAHYKGKHEPCYYAHRKGKSARWHGPNNEVTLWECDRSARNDWHPTQKPVELAVRALRNSSALNDIVLDLFLGGGTTLIASQQLGRRCFALEIDPGYTDVSVRRWEEFTGRTAELVR